jgi:hypothetical protein
MIVNLQERDRELLKDLVAEAEIFATQAMMKVGHVPPTLLIQTSEGREMFMSADGQNQPLRVESKPASLRQR